MPDRLTIPLLVILALSCTVKGAFAQQVVASAEKADALLGEGRALRSRNELEGALHAFLAADDVGRSGTTALELARLQSVMGLLVEARQTLRRVLAAPATASDPTPAVRANAEKLDDEAKGRLVFLRIEVTGLGGGAAPSISVDDQPVPIAPNVTLFVNPGRHVIVAKTSSRDVSRTVDAHEGQRITVPLSFDSLPGQAATEQKATGSQAPRSRALPALANFGLGLAVTGVAVGGLTGFLSLMSKNAAARACANRCPPSASSAPDSSQAALGKISAVSLAIGAAGAGLALGSILFRDRGQPTARSTPRSVARSLEVKPMRGGAGFSVNF